jgi:hypothetical protein
MCGRVRFVVTFPSLFCCHCHCESCRRSRSAGVVSWIGLPSAQVQVEAGGDCLAVYESSSGTTRADRTPERDVFFAEHAAWIAAPLTGRA